MAADKDRTTALIERLRAGFVDDLWKGMLFLALVGAPMSVMRSAYTGWLAIYDAHLFLAAAIVFVFALGNRLATPVRAALLHAILWTVGLLGIFTLGFPATSVWWLVLSCLIASTTHSPRAGAVLGLATGLVVVIAAFGFVGGRLHLAIDPTTYLRNPGTWASLLVVVGVFTTMVLRSNWAYQRSLAELLAEVARQREQLELRSMHDPLTGLPMAQLAADRIDMALRGARRSGRKVAVLFIDLDDFKSVNDGLGHAAGDQVLREVATRLLRTVRAGDTIARIGGDELIAVLADVPDQATASAVAARVIATIGEPIALPIRAVTIGASVGISLFPDHAQDAPGLREQADQAMYSAKRGGKNRVAVATAPLAIGA